jgi:hypothetical protein
MIRLTPTDDSRLMLDRFFDRLERLPRLLADDDEPIRESIRRGFALNFEREAEGNGRPWSDLAESTNEERIRQGYPPEHPILVRSGSYRASFVEEFAEGHVSAQGVSDVRLLIEEGSGDIRVGTLELGWVNIPPRPVLGLHQVARDEIGDEIDALIDALFAD